MIWSGVRHNLRAWLHREAFQQVCVYVCTSCRAAMQYVYMPKPGQFVFAYLQGLKVNMMCRTALVK